MLGLGVPFFFGTDYTDYTVFCLGREGAKDAKGFLVFPDRGKTDQEKATPWGCGSCFIDIIGYVGRFVSLFTFLLRGGHARQDVLPVITSQSLRQAEISILAIASYGTKRGTSKPACRK
jgi:hypothetical protein